MEKIRWPYHFTIKAGVTTKAVKLFPRLSRYFPWRSLSPKETAIDPAQRLVSSLLIILIPAIWRNSMIVSDHWTVTFNDQRQSWHRKILRVMKYWRCCNSANTSSREVSSYAKIVSDHWTLPFNDQRQSLNYAKLQGLILSAKMTQVAEQDQSQFL